ncbi:M23 family metallopeptidase [Paenibacillus sp. MBLB4367]|uniref:M23 family metallopeptidase n=1 Tax=Paenibacillus sp. MBLB4367 TaxID=3384767 RepID=UPI0039081994
MDWILALFLVWGSLTAAADEQARLDAVQREAVAKEEAALFQEQADAVLKEDVALLPDTTYPGDAVLVRSKSQGDIVWQNKTYPLQPYANGFYAMLPVAIDAKPGTYTIAGKKLQIKAKTFDVDRLTVTKEQEQMRQDTQRIAKDQAKIDLARSKSEPDFLYKEPFILPVAGRLTTPYGYTRYVNGTFSGTHAALDLAAPTGTPVKATNAGKVVLSEELYLTGNSIYIDHGMNLFSQYAHLSKLLVKAGDEVKAGDVIGEVGSTGFSTGPHLHFTFWVGNNPVNPNLFFDTVPFRWKPK